jgi:hypothetical protein
MMKTNDMREKININRDFVIIGLINNKLVLCCHPTQRRLSLLHKYSIVHPDKLVVVEEYGTN